MSRLSERSPKRSRTVVLAAALLAAGALAAAPAEAGGRHGHRSHIHFGLSIGVPLAAGIGWHYGPGFYGHPYYAYYPYAPRVVVVPPPAPVTYIEQPAPPAPAAQAPAQNWWYWCAAANAYYPYVSECAGGWQRVAPQPPAAR